MSFKLNAALERELTQALEPKVQAAAEAGAEVLRVVPAGPWPGTNIGS